MWRRSGERRPGKGKAATEKAVAALQQVKRGNEETRRRGDEETRRRGDGVGFEPRSAAPAAERVVLYTTRARRY